MTTSTAVRTFSEFAAHACARSIALECAPLFSCLRGWENTKRKAVSFFFFCERGGNNFCDFQVLCGKYEYLTSGKVQSDLINVMGR